MAEIDPLILSYSHLPNFPRASEALHILKKIASIVKPLMRARGWKVKQLTEFFPDQQNLLGLNVGRGMKICLRLRYPGDKTQFMPLEQVTDTMLHELAHNVHGPHDGKFHALWNQLRDEHESLILKGYTGEGFLSEGHRLGGRRIPKEEARRLARAAAEKRRTHNSGTGQRLGGVALQPGQDIRRVIANAVEQRNRTLRGCANDNQTQEEIVEIANTATRNGFRTQAEEDAANEAAIAQALWEMIKEDEQPKKGDTRESPNLSTTCNAPSSSRNSKKSNATAAQPTRSQDNTMQGGSCQDACSTWTCNVCTLVNPATFLCCDACSSEKPERADRGPGMSLKRSKTSQPVIDLTDSSNSTPTERHNRLRDQSSRPTTMGSGPRTAPPMASGPQTWTCHFCGNKRDKQWWSCDLCGSIKLESKS
ncbi:WLM-domain-containing protein [Xylariaceae sp. FL1019]|nr:WLM-domain-containing protein [Xylariaceae sp. FL1019]